MRVKIGNEMFDSIDKPILLILSEQEKTHISEMSPNAKYYCSYPEGIDVHSIDAFIKDAAPELYEDRRGTRS